MSEYSLVQVIHYLNVTDIIMKKKKNNTNIIYSRELKTVVYFELEHIPLKRLL